MASQDEYVVAQVLNSFRPKNLRNSMQGQDDADGSKRKPRSKGFDIPVPDRLVTNQKRNASLYDGAKNLRKLVLG